MNMSIWKITFILLIISSGILYFIFSSALINLYIFHPDKQGEIAKSSFPKFVQELRLNTNDGEQLQVFHFSQERRKSRSLIIYFHGNAGNAYHRFDPAQKLFEMGTDVLLVSYRGYGNSSGKPTEKGIYIDGKAVIDYAIEVLGYAEQEIILFGRSLGTSVVVELAQDRKFGGIILVAPFTSGKAMAKVVGLGAFSFAIGDSFNSIEKIKKLRSDILIIHGKKDGIIPYRMGQELYNRYPGDKQMITIPGGGHNNLEIINPEMYWDGIKKYLLKNAKYGAE